MGENKIPGVYIEEKHAFNNSVVDIETAIPVFIGLTEKAQHDKDSFLNKPVKIASMTEYLRYFGGEKRHRFNVKVTAAAEGGALSVKCGSNELQAKLEDNLCTLYYHLLLFFANGGDTCYVVSIGGYDKTFGDAYESAKETVFTGIKEVPDITILVVPEAANDSSCMSVYNEMLGLCETKKYFAIFDIPKVINGKTGNEAIEEFRTAIGTTNLQFAAAYYPWLETSLLSDNDIDGTIMYFNESPGSGIYCGNTAVDKYIVNTLAEIDNARNDEDKKKLRNDLHNILLQCWPEYKQLSNQVKAFLNQLPPSAIMAGIYAINDKTRGVWKAPANISINYVNKPAVEITDHDQEDLNVPMNGKSVNAIRVFPGQGTKVWGARTMDGNSLEWRYINVCRMAIFLEQSVKNAARAWVFEPNDANTWIGVKLMLENFLRSVWKRGGLAGATPEDAYKVHIGPGETMTHEDVLEGIMRITVLVALSRPADFVEINFQLQMQKS